MQITEVNHLYLRDGKLNPELVNKDILIYGCKDAGKHLSEAVQRNGGRVKAFVDRRFKDYGEEGFSGCPVIAPSCLKEHKNCSLLMSFAFWPQIIGDIPSDIEVYADYPFWEKDGRECMICRSRETVCKESAFVPFLKDRMFNGNAPETLWIHCRNCEVSYSSYRPKDEEFARLYSGYRGKEYTAQRQQYEPGYDNDAIFGEGPTAKRRQDVYGFCKDVITETPGTILDYGGDRGQYIPEEWADSDRYVYEISGNETIPGVKVISDLESAADHKWDLIMNCHVLEHVSDPGEILKNIRTLMDEDTYLYLELPCEFLFKDSEVHEHINMFTKRTLRVLGEKNGFKIVKLGNPDCGGAIAAIYRKTAEK